MENVSNSRPVSARALPALMRPVLRSAVPVVAIALTVSSAIVAKKLGGKPPLLASVNTPAAVELPAEVSPASFVAEAEVVAPVEIAAEAADQAEPAVEAELDPASRALASDASVRWFDGRPVRPVRIMTMEVTAYSPDAKSCGRSADGQTATLHSVATNGFALVAADPTVLKYGSMLTVPGYDKDRIVPVLDCGSAIKGRRLDVIFPTDAQAMAWGRKTLKVVVWEYADGKPALNPRRQR